MEMMEKLGGRHDKRNLQKTSGRGHMDRGPWRRRAPRLDGLPVSHKAVHLGAPAVLPARDGGRSVGARPADRGGRVPYPAKKAALASPKTVYRPVRSHRAGRAAFLRSALVGLHLD